MAGEAPGGAGGTQALAASGGWPLLADPLSGARMGVPAVSAYEAILRHPGFAGAMRPDLVVRVGRMGTSKPLASYLGPEVPQVVVDPDGDWADPTRSAQWIIRAGPGMLPSLVEAAPGAVLLDQARVREFRLGVFVKGTQVGVRRGGVQVKVALLDVLAVVAFRARQPEEPLF